MSDTSIDTDVAQLEKRAEELASLIAKQPGKRPLILEFSGSPKAGKTRSIGVLELFLKRNGLKVAVFLERASVAPIKSKGRQSSGDARSPVHRRRRLYS